MKKARNGPFWLGAFVLSLAALFTACQGPPTQTTSEPNSLQGYWAGEGREGNGPRWKCSLTITGNSLHCFRDSNYWFRTTFTLPAGTEPRQLHATIKDTSHVIFQAMRPTMHCNPFDEVVIAPDSARWLLFYHHDERFYFGNRNG